MFIRTETLNALLKAMSRTIDEDKDKSRRVQCVLHERGMKLDRTPLDKGGRGMSALDVSDEGVNLYAFTTCGHSKAPCQARVIFPLFKDGKATIGDLPTKMVDGDSVIDIDALTQAIMSSGLLKASAILLHASVRPVSNTPAEPVSAEVAA